ncbi:heterokaryon incompatibility protein-domain-containing protein [Paraphoma chrysanthemicola]|nr:heterokaryon incompatibility protein-domain-containing protein [Paraphoma chrysanthemicola]
MVALSVGEDVPALSDEHKLRSPYAEQSLQPGEIRLLTIDATITANNSEAIANPGGVTLRLVTKRVSLEEKPKFDAISYVWGTAPASVVVECNGAPLLVTPTAYDMLQHLRLYRPNLYLPVWIDAICINQNDPDEKSHQIQQMTTIFSWATSVIVWMGLSNQCIQAFMEDFPRVQHLARKWTPISWTKDPMWRGADWPVDHDDFWVGLYYFLDHDWFRRRWTFQEFVLAQNATFICGSFCIDAILFSNFVADGCSTVHGYLPYNADVASRVATKPTFSRLALTACNALKWSRNNRSTHNCGLHAHYVPGLLYSIQNLRVQEPVDKVWAIAGLLVEHLQDKLAPSVDYSEKGREEYWRTYISFAKTLLEEGPSLSLLDMPPPLTKRDPNLPSWCIDFSGQFSCLSMIDGEWNTPIGLYPGHYPPLLYDDNDHHKSVDRRVAVMDHPMKLISVLNASNVLCIRGFILDTISDIVDDVTLFGQVARIRDSSSMDWNMDNPLHVATIKLYGRALSLARRKLLGGDHFAAIPSEFLMSIWTDCRIVEDTERAYKDAWTSFTERGRQYYFSLESSRKDSADAVFRRLIPSDQTYDDLELANNDAKILLENVLKQRARECSLCKEESRRQY